MDKPTISLSETSATSTASGSASRSCPSPTRRPATSWPRVPSFGEAETRAAIEAANRALPGLVEDAGQGALQDRAPLVRPDDRARRRAGAAAHQRAGQAAGRGQGRDRLCRRLRRVLRRGGQARLRRDHPDLQGRRAHRRHQAAGRRGGGHHAVELPRRHDHAQGGPGAGGRLHGGVQAGLRDAADRAGAGRAGRARRHPQGRVQRHHRQGQRDRQGADLQPRSCACSPSRARPRSAPS